MTDLVKFSPAASWSADRDEIVASLQGKDLQVTTVSGADRAAGVVSRIAYLRKQLHQQRMEITRPLEAAKKEAIAIEKAQLKGLDSIETEIRKQLGIFARKQEAAQRAAENAAREAAAEAAAKAAAENAEPEQVAAAAETAAAAHTVQAPAKVAGTAFVTRWDYEIVDVSTIPVGFLKPDPVDGAVVRRYLTDREKRGLPTEIPGLKVSATKTPRIRA